jgi:triphosphoribosyl-dephospho-CoA synthase
MAGGTPTGAGDEAGRSAAVAAAFLAACDDELAALKPGNVHRYADGHRMTVADFEASAAAAAPAIAAVGARVGARVLAAVDATRAAVGTNTNLGIVLLAAPLARAAEARGPLRPALAAVLADLDVADAADAFRAIVLASPAGLGRSDDHDVAAPATATLRAAMAAAAGRDRIARQYVTDFSDVFDLGLPTLRTALARLGDRAAATTAIHLAFLAAFPDSHVVRKHGAAAAEAVRGEAAALLAAGAGEQPALHHEALVSFDKSLKNRGFNPGTTADLTVATLFAERLAGGA